MWLGRKLLRNSLFERLGTVLKVEVDDVKSENKGVSSGAVPCQECSGTEFCVPDYLPEGPLWWELKVNSRVPEVGRPVKGRVKSNVPYGEMVLFYLRVSPDY